MTPEQIERLKKWDANPNSGLAANDIRALLAEWEERGRLADHVTSKMTEAIEQVEKFRKLAEERGREIERLKALVRRLALALIDANRLDYPWKDGSRASKALDEAEILVGEGEK